MKFWMLWWLLPSFIACGGALNCSQLLECSGNFCFMNKTILREGPRDGIISALQCMENTLMAAAGSGLIQNGSFMAKVFRIFHIPALFGIYANGSEIKESPDVSNLKITAFLPTETLKGRLPIVAFFTFYLPNRDFFPEEVYEGRLIGLKVNSEEFSGLQQRVNITIHNVTNINDSLTPQCVFLNYSTREFSTEGCLTQREPGWSHITCSCDHLTIFAVLLVNLQSSGGPTSVSAEDLEILTYISLVGCSLSLVTMIIAVLIFITNKQMRADDSKKVHISLVAALILLNMHFLPSEMVAKTSSTELCFYMALSLHYYLLASLSWMALEGFHLYLLLVKVFNIYIQRYMLKISLVGWGVPALIVSVVLIVDREAYGHVSLDLSNPNGTKICYLTNITVKSVSGLGVFGLVFLFNVAIFVVTIKWVLSCQASKQFGKSDRDGAKRNLCTLLSIMLLIGVTWGTIFFSYGYLSTFGLYIFCIMNSLQGFFIFIYFVMSCKKNKSAAKMTNTTPNTNS